MWSLDVRRLDAGCGTDARDAEGTQRRKGRRDAKDAEDAEACVVGFVITLPLVVALVIALSFEAIRQLPSASVFDHEKAKTRGLCT